MNNSIPLLVFSDLDGTLIDHQTYSWVAARPAIERLKGIGAGVVLASSKTAPEIIALRSDLGLTEWPAIVENGAGILAAGASIAHANTPYLALQRVVNDAPPNLRAYFRGFGDMDPQGIAQITGLSLASATLAAQRSFSEPGLWSGDDADLDLFLVYLEQSGVVAREGGRFLTLSLGQTKADRMAQIVATYKPRHTVALGDAPNDIEMLQAADFGVVVANPHRDPLPALTNEDSGRIQRTELAGPEGWNMAVLELIARLKLE